MNSTYNPTAELVGYPPGCPPLMAQNIPAELREPRLCPGWRLRTAILSFA